MTKAAFIKINGGLFPCDPDGHEIMDALKPGKQVMVNVHAPRNVRHHRLMFQLFNKVIEGGAWDGDVDSLKDAVKLATGHVERLISLDGEVSYKLKPLTFESLPQDQFSKFFDRACFYISTRLLRSDDWEALRDEVIAIADGQQGVQARELAARYG